MKMFCCGKKEFSPYRNLTQEDNDLDIISLKEQQLRRCDRILTILLSGALVFCVGLITCLTAIMAETEHDMTPFANTAFTSKLYEILRKTPGNVFFSPFSLQVALAMVYSGASGTTAQQLQKSAYFTENREVLHKAVQDTSNALTSSKDVVLNVANAVYVQRNYPIKESFLNQMKGVFKAEAKELEFAKSVEAAKEINGFVNKETKGKITELFSPDAFDALTKMVLVNAVYFKGAWRDQFDPEYTYKGDFHLNKTNKVQVDFMKLTKKFNALEDDTLKATIVELPYEGDLSMVLIVPNEIEGLKELEEKLVNVDLKNLTDRTFSREVALTMPKFKLEKEMDLNEPLKKLGIEDMFNAEKAEFSGITEGKNLYVSNVIQKAFIEVNEQGSEAAAATGVKFLMRMMPIPPVEVTANRPFFFLLKHSQGPVLFAGRLSHPN